jgi:hypothetical protein
MKIVPMMPADRAALDDVVPDVVEALARPEGLGQEPVDEAARMRRKAAIEEEGAGGLEIDVQSVVEFEAAARALQVQAIPVKTQSVSQQCGGCIRQVEDAALGVAELEGRLKGPPHTTQRKVRSSQRAPYGRPRTGQTANYLARFLA